MIIDYGEIDSSLTLIKSCAKTRAKSVLKGFSVWSYRLSLRLINLYLLQINSENRKPKSVYTYLVIITLDRSLDSDKHL